MNRFLGLEPHDEIVIPHLPLCLLPLIIIFQKKSQSFHVVIFCDISMTTAHFEQGFFHESSFYSKLGL